MYKASVSANIEAAHFLFLSDQDEDVRKKIHGHSYVCKAWVSGRQLNDQGVILDLDEARDKLRAICAQLNNTLLNDHEDLKYPSMECLCKYIFDQINKDARVADAIEIERPALGFTVIYSP